MTITAGGADTATTDSVHLGRRLGLFAAVLVASIALPFLFLGEGNPSWYHLVFHLTGITVCTLAVLALRSIRRASTSAVLRVMTWVVSVAYVAWTLGHAGELVTVLTHGGAHADEHLFEHPVHVFFANIAIPSWMLSVLSGLVLLATAGTQALVRRVRR